MITGGCSRKRWPPLPALTAAPGGFPIAVCAGAGSTNTGAVDPLAGLADVCAAEGLWLHVDAAYGGFAALTPKGRALLAGIERADSVTLDPHKWLFQPFECGGVLIRDGARLARTFAIHPDYLDSTGTHGDRGGQPGRLGAAAVPGLPCAEGLDVRAGLRPGRVPRCHRPQHGTGLPTPKNWSGATTR